MPWKIVPRDNEFCVVKQSDGKTVGCHPTREKAKAQLAALNASEDEKAKVPGVGVGGSSGGEAVPPPTGELSDDSLKKEAVSEDQIVSSWVPWGVTSFVELDQVQEARAASQGVNALTHQFTEMTHHIMWDSDINDKSAAVRTLTGEFTQRLDEAMDEFTPKEKSIIERVTAEIKSKLFGSDDGGEIEKASPLTIWKEADGTYNWFLIYSNNYRDDDSTPEILSADAHKDFVKAVDSGEWPMPELWYWHIPGSRMGQANLVAYDDETGFAVAAGVFDKGMESVAESLSKRTDHLVSHGMPVEEIRRDADDPTILTRYRSKEFSTLPDVAAANKLTGSFITLKEDLNMAIPEQKLQALAELGFDVDALTGKLESAKAQADQEQRESKEVQVEEEVEAKDAETEVMAEEEVAESSEPVAETEPELEEAVELDETAEEEDKEVEPAPEPILQVLELMKEVVTEAVTPINERLEQLEGRFAQEDADQKAIEEELEALTPAASFNAMIRSGVLGEKEAQVDGRKARYEGPKETEVPTQSRTGLPVNTFLDDMLNGKDWRDAMGIQQD